MFGNININLLMCFTILQYYHTDHRAITMNNLWNMAVFAKSFWKHFYCYYNRDNRHNAEVPIPDIITTKMCRINKT